MSTPKINKNITVFNFMLNLWGSWCELTSLLRVCFFISYLRAFYLTCPKSLIKKSCVPVDFLIIDDFIISFFVPDSFNAAYGLCKIASNIFNPDAGYSAKFIDGFLYLVWTIEIESFLYLTDYFFIIEVFKLSTSGLANKLLTKSFFFAFWNPYVTKSFVFNYKFGIYIL